MRSRLLCACLAATAVAFHTQAATARAAPKPRTRTQPLLVADVGPLSPDERLVFAALQGIVNRDRPRVYLEGMDDTAATWLRDAVPLPTRRVAPFELVKQFRSRLHGVVVWDPSLAADPQNVPPTVAGQRDLLPVSPDLAAVLGAPPYRLPVRLDLRALHLAGRAQTYDWALGHLGPPSRFGALAWHGGPRHGLRDLLVARRAFVFQADPELDSALVERILRAFPMGTPVFGYICLDDKAYATTTVPACEPAGVSEISSAGDFLVPSDLAANLTVHSSFPAVRQRPPWNDAPSPPDPTKTY